jgi:hypothetical protein
VEHRSAIRYRLQRPVIFFWEDARGIRCRGKGVTHDVSEVGAYVLSTTCPPLQVEVEIEILSSERDGMPSLDYS